MSTWPLVGPVILYFIALLRIQRTRRRLQDLEERVIPELILRLESLEQSDYRASIENLVDSAPAVLRDFERRIGKLESLNESRDSSNNLDFGGTS